MNKAIHSVDSALACGGASRYAAGRRAERHESDGFSRVLGAEQAQRPAERTAPEGGKDLPESRQTAVDTDREQAATDATQVRDADQADGEDGVAMEQSSASDTTDAAQTAGTDAPLPADMLTGESEPAAAADPESGEPAPLATGLEPATPDAPGIPLPDVATAQPETDTKAEPAATAAADVAALAVPSAESEPRAEVRHRSQTDPVGAAVRESIMQQQAAHNASGNAGGDATSGGEAGTPREVEPTVTSRAAAAGIVSFSNTLSETTAGQPSARVSVPVGQPGWARAVGEQMVWFLGQRIQSASLRLHPQHLGPLELHLQMDGDRASVAFTSQHAAVREALESSLPRLRDMLAEQGLNLVNVNVSQQGDGNRREHAVGGGRAGNGLASSGDTGESSVLAGPGAAGTGVAQGLVDYYV